MGTMMLNGRPYGNTSMGNQEYSEIELWSGNITQGSGVLSEPLTAYDAIMIFGSGYYDSSAGNTLIITELIPTNELNYNRTYLLNANSGEDRRIFIAFSDATHFSIDYYGSSYCNIHKILGIKYATGGTVVEANPRGIPTRVLNSIKINNHVYKMNDNSFYKETVLWSNSNGITVYPASPVQITLSQSIDDFNMIFIESSIESDSTYRNNNITPVSSIDKTGNIYFNNVNIGGHDYHVPTVSCEDATHFTLRGYASANPMMFYKITGIRFGNSDISPIIYSTEEREIGVWIDNKPLYQKTVTVTLDAQTTLIPYTNDIDTLVEVNGKATYGTNTDTIPYCDGEDYIFVRNSEGAGVTVYTANWFVQREPIAEITLQYTKTTDVPGSGSYNTLGIPTVHYSTDEQVIGTDYDGKPIYQKTYTNLGTINSSTNIDLQLSNISWITVDSANSSLSSGIPFPYLHPNANNIIGYFMDLNGGSPIINCRAGNDASGTFTLDKLTVRYKKTTD